MMHPSTGIQKISDEMGLGVFALKPIKAGSVIYALDPLDVRLPPGDPRLEDPRLQAEIDLYAYTDSDGAQVICWDHGKYVNHACEPNTLSTGYDFQIALRDIAAGEQITEDYGLFHYNFGPLLCGEPNCRGYVRESDFHEFAPVWDAKVKRALKHFFDVDQPLAALLPEDVLADIRRFVDTGTEGYRTVTTSYEPDAN